jgi:ABC-type antimicrobial peptide transport system permease subunit
VAGAVHARARAIDRDVLVRGITTMAAIVDRETRWLASLLLGIRPLDPWTYAATVTVVIAATAAASLLPVYRASRLDPMTLLREE